MLMIFLKEAAYILFVLLMMFLTYRLSKKENRKAAMWCILFIGMERYLRMLLDWLF